MYSQYTATVFVLGIMKFFYVHSGDGRREKWKKTLFALEQNLTR